MQHAEGRTGDCPGPRKGATTRRNVTQGGGGGGGSNIRTVQMPICVCAEGAPGADMLSVVASRSPVQKKKHFVPQHMYLKMISAMW